MSQLVERFQSHEDKIPVHTFWAAIVELSEGEITVAQIKSAFNIVDPDEVAELTWLLDKLSTGVVSASRFHGMCLLLEEGLYTAQKARDILNGV